MVGGPGFEPGLMESESIVLPLNDPPIISYTDFKTVFEANFEKNFSLEKHYIVN